MKGWEALEIARKNPKVKIKYKCAEKVSFILQFSESEERFMMKTHEDDFFGHCNVDLNKHAANDNWEILKPEPKIISWYRPKIVWVDQKEAPTRCFDEDFHKTKCQSNWYPYTGLVVIEWDEIKAPEEWSDWELGYGETWEQCK